MVVSGTLCLPGSPLCSTVQIELGDTEGLFLFCFFKKMKATEFVRFLDQQTGVLNEGNVHAKALVSLLPADIAGHCTDAAKAGGG